MRSLRFTFFLVIFMVQSQVWAQYENVAVRPLICDDQELPGHPGVTMRLQPGDVFVLGDGGHVLGYITLTGEGVDASNDWALVLIDPGGTVAVVLRDGDPLGGGTLDWKPQHMSLSAGGDYVFSILIRGDPHLGAIVTGSGGSATIELSPEGQAPGGFDAGARIGWFGNPVMNSNGTYAVLADINASPTVEDSTSHDVIYSSGATVAVRNRTYYPGLPPGEDGQESGFSGEFGGGLQIDEAGNLYFHSIVDDGQVGMAPVEGLWRFSGGTATEVILQDQAAPGLSGLTMSSAGIQAEGGGKLAILGGLRGDDVIPSDRNTAYWIGSEGGFSLVVREGDSAPVLEGHSGGVFREGIDISMSEKGTALLQAVLAEGAGFGYWYWNGALSNIAIAGGVVSGNPEYSWTQLENAVINPNGLVAVEGWVQGPSGPLSGMWVSDNGGTLHKVEVPESILLPTGETQFGAVRKIFDGGFNKRNEVLIEYGFNCLAVASLDGRLDLGSIEGRVELDQDNDGESADDDQGLEGFLVRLNRSANGELVAETSTSGGGHYEFLDVEPGNYIVNVDEPEGYQSTGDIDDTEQDKTPGTIAINLGDNQQARGLDFLLWPIPGEGTISGFILEDPNGDGNGDDAVSGIEGAEVTLNDPETRRKIGDSIFTDMNGFFSFSGIPEGDYILAVGLAELNPSVTFTNARSTGIQLFSIETVTVPQEEPITLLASEINTISGRVTDDSNPPNGIPNTRIQFTFEDGRVPSFIGRNPTYTDSNGEFEFRTIAGDYLVEAKDQPGFRSVDDSQGLPTDNRIAVSVLSGTDSSGHSFVDARKPFVISWHRLSESGVKNLNKPEGSNPATFPEIEPLLPVDEWAILDIQPAVSEGLVADGVTPLLIKFCSSEPVTDPVNVQWIVEELSGGNISGGILSHMQNRVDGEWTPANFGFNSGTLTQIDPCEFALIEALDPRSLIFEPGSKEIVLLFKVLSEGENPALLAEERIIVRRPPLLLRSKLAWSDAFVDTVSEHVPDDFLKVTASGASADTLDSYFPGIRRAWAVNRMDVVVQGISGLGIRQELEAHIYRESYDLYRGAIGRLIFVGTPHRGSRLVPYLNEVESRLKEMGLSRSFPRILPASGGEAFTWNDLIEGSNGSGSPLLNRMHPNDRLFRSESVYDPHTSVINLVTDIDSENAPAFKRVGLRGAALRAVFRLGTDGFLGLLSGTATSSVYDLGGQINGDRIREEDQWIAHGEPAEAFAADQSQTKSQKVAERINELFDKDNKGVPVFYTFARPSPLSIGEIESIRAAAQDVPLADIVDIESFLLGGNTSSGDSALLPHMQVFEEGVRKFEYQFDPPGSYPIVGEVFWTAELHGPDGVTSKGVSLETDSMDSSKVTVSVDPLVTGDVVLFLSYETTDGALVFGEPQWVTHQRPLLGDVDHMELLPDGHSLRIGESYESEVVTVYTDGTRLPRWLDPKAVENVSSSDPEVLSVANFPEVEALKAGVATLTVEAFGLMAEAQITVEAEPASLDYEDWKANFFSETELDDPSISGDSVDLDGDSLNLFLEFITGGDPRIPNPGFLPRITKVVQGSAEESVIGLRVSTRVADESVRAEHSTDLQDWNEIADLASSTALNNTSIVDYIEGDGYRELFLKLNESIPAFYRLSVQSSNP